MSSPPPRPRRSPPRALLAALRPRQWSKNLVVFAALVLTGGLRDPHKTTQTLLVFGLFCAISSAVYLMNDLADRESDRLHPEKRHRPLAAGELQPWLAMVAAALLTILGVVGAFAMGPTARGLPMVGYVVLAYLTLQLAYTFVLKHYLIVDVLAIAGGFVLRVLAGGAAIDEPISPYLYLSMIFLALFQGFSKRRHELEVLADVAGSHRPSLDEYTVPLLDQFIGTAATATIVTYALYAITTPHRPEHISPNVLLLTVPFVIYAILRYLYLVQVRGMGGAPEEILLRDRPLLLAGLGWGLSLVTILYLIPLLPS